MSDRATTSLADVQRTLLRAVAPLAACGARFTLLSFRILCSMPVANVSQTSAKLGVHSVTFHNNVRPLIDKGLVEERGRAARGSGLPMRYALTPQGEALFAHLLPRTHGAAENFKPTNGSPDSSDAQTAHS